VHGNQFLIHQQTFKVLLFMGIFCFNEMFCKQTMLMNITCTEVRSQLEMALVSPETDEICNVQTLAQ
jgi:hypothetical protein